MVFDEIKVTTDDEYFMLEALKEARLAYGLGEVPVGSVIVRNGEIIARAHNLVETNGSSLAHAEMEALRTAQECCGKWLNDATVYVTLEPCSMCAGAMVLARIKRLVIGASDPKTGACGSLLNVANNEKLNHRIEVTSGVLDGQCGDLIREFFRDRRASK